jgi:hypothetical protein
MFLVHIHVFLCSNTFFVSQVSNKYITSLHHPCWFTIFCYFAKVGTQILFLLQQIANPQTLGLIPYSEIRKFLRYASTYANCKSSKFPCPSPPIANPQICQEKSIVSDPDPNWPPPIFFSLRKYILDYEMPCASKLSQKPKAVLKFEWKHFKLIFVRRKNMYSQIFGSFKSQKKNWVRKSQIRKSQKIPFSLGQLSPLLPFPVWISIHVYSVCVGGGGGGWGLLAKEIKTYAEKSISKSIFLDDDILHCLLWVFYF